MGEDTNINILIRAINDGATAVLDGVKRSVSALADASGAAGAKMGAIGDGLDSAGSKLKATGATMTQSLTIPIVAVGAAVVKMGMDFESNMELIRTQAGAPQAEVDSLRQKVLDLAKVSAQGPNELAEGLYHLESLGYRGAKAMDALTTSSQMAAVGHAKLESVTNALGAALVTGIRGTEDMSRAAGTLDATIGQGNMRMEDLVAALGTGVLPAAKNFGLSLTDVGAALATLTDNGMRADESATRLRMTFALMAAPSTKAAGIFKDIGMASNQLATDMRDKGLVPALTDLNDHLIKTYGTTEAGKTKIATALSEAFGGGRSSAAIMTLLQQLDRVKSKYGAIEEGSGQFAEKLAATQETAAFKASHAWAELQASAIEIGGKLLPALVPVFQDLAKYIEKFADWLSRLKPGQVDLLVKSLLLLAAAGPGLTIVGNALKLLALPFKIAQGLLNMPLAVKEVAKAFFGVDGAMSGVTRTFRFLNGTSISGLSAMKRSVGLVTDAFNFLRTTSVSDMMGIIRQLFSTQGVVRLLQITISTPVGLAISIAAALALLAYVMMKVQEVKSAIAGAQKAQQNLDAQNIAILQRAAQTTDPAKKAALVKIANSGQTYSLDKSTQFWGNFSIPGFASGIENFGGGLAYVHGGEVLANLPKGTSVIPKNKVNAGGGGGAVTNIYGPINLGDKGAVTEFFKRIGRNQELAAHGLTPAGY